MAKRKKLGKNRKNVIKKISQMLEADYCEQK